MHKQRLLSRILNNYLDHEIIISIDDKKTVTIKEFSDAILFIQHTFMKSKLYDKVVILCVSDKLAYIEMIIALIDLGVPVIPLSEHELESLLSLYERLDCARIVCDHQNGKKIKDLFRDVIVTRKRIGEFDVFDMPIRNKVESSNAYDDFMEHKIALAMPTSGTTGQAKLVCLSWNNLLSNCEQFAEAMKIGKTDVFLSILPLHHVHGLVVNTLLPLMYGAQIALHKHYNIHSVLRAIRQDGVTFFSTVPYVIKSLIEICAETVPNNLRLCCSASDYIPSQLISEFQRTFGLDISQGYGLTETTCGALTNLWNETRTNSIGLPLPRTDVIILSPLRQQMKSNEIGEIAIRGQQVMIGYYQDGQFYKDNFHNGYFLTGDYGYRDEDGYYHFVERNNNFIKRKGVRISPIEIKEKIIATYLAIRDLEIIGIQELGYGEKIVAVVSLFKDTDIVRKHLIQNLNESLPYHQQIDEISFVLPTDRNPVNGLKMKKRCLEKMAVIRCPMVKFREELSK